MGPAQHGAENDGQVAGRRLGGHLMDSIDLAQAHQSSTVVTHRPEGIAQADGFLDRGNHHQVRIEVGAVIFEKGIAKQAIEGVAGIFFQLFGLVGRVTVPDKHEVDLATGIALIQQRFDLRGVIVEAALSRGAPDQQETGHQSGQLPQFS